MGVPRQRLPSERNTETHSPTAQGHAVIWQQGCVFRKMQKHRGVPAMAQNWWSGWGALLILVAGHAAAQDAPLAIGRISYGDTLRPGAAICTGVLVAPDLVLTARHCLEGFGATPATVHFAAGFAERQRAALGQGAEVILPEAAVTTNRANDVALLRLKAPMAADLLTPLSQADPALRKWLPLFSVIAYRRDAPEPTVRRDDCKLLTTLPGILALSCPVVSGNSGAPVLAWDGTDWRIIGVMVASTNGGQVQSLAAIVPPDLRARMQAATQP